MKRCVTCEGLLEDSQFSGDSPICKTCVTRLNMRYDVEYTPPERKTRKEATINLVLAIQAQAEKDEDVGIVTADDKLLGGPMAAWKHNWVDSEPWRRIWDIMLSVEDSHSRILSETNRHMRRFH